MNKTQTIIFAISILLLSVFSAPLLAADSQPLTKEEMEKAKLLAYELTLQKYIVWESDEAYEPYFDGNFEVAKHSLTHLTRILEYLKDKKIAQHYAPQDLAFTYMRLGKIAEKEQNENLAKEYFEKGITAYNAFLARNSKEGYTLEKLRSFIDKTDENSKDGGRLLPVSLREVLPSPKKEPNK